MGKTKTSFQVRFFNVEHFNDFDSAVGNMSPMLSGSRTRSDVLLCRLAGILLFIGAAVCLAPMSASAATTNKLSIPLINKTGLDKTHYTIYVLGYSTGRTDPTTVSPKTLVVNAATKTGSFDTNAATAGYIQSFKLGDEITSIAVERGTESIAGARVFFFIADNRLSYVSNGLPPRFAYSDSGTKVVQCMNPPQTDYPIYNYIEFTSIFADNYGAVIDVSAVDGFNFPISITLNDNKGNPLGQPVGYASTSFNRSTILGNYASFMTNLASDGGSNYLAMQYTDNGGGLLNPTFYLDQPSKAGWISPLNNAFDNALDAFFSSSNAGKLSITTDGSGAIAMDTYTSTYSAVETYPGTAMQHPALNFTGISNKHKFTVFNPVNFTILNYTVSNALQHIRGQMNNTNLIFTTPLPGNTKIVSNMYVEGPGANADTRVVAIKTNAIGQIASLILSNGSGIAGAGYFRFSKSSKVLPISAGMMVFGCNGLFDSPQALAGSDLTVLLALKRDIVTAFNRGVANISPATGVVGRTSTYWGTQTNWYPAGQAQNLFSLYMHTATVKVGAQDVPLFTRPDNPVRCARKTLMGMSYGFAYDENSVHVAGIQPQVPAKHDPLPAGVDVTTITLGAWQPGAAGIVANDFDNDRRSDFAILDKSQSAWYVLAADQATAIAWAVPWGLPGTRSVSGDFDGDGKSDFAIFDQNSGMWYVLAADQATPIAWALSWGIPGAVPVSGDYDGDGKSDFAIFDQASSMWYVLAAEQATALAWELSWGIPGAVPVSGDYDGDGKSDFAVFDQNAGLWYVLAADQATVLGWGVPWGMPGAVPVSGDYEGDGKSDFAVFDPVAGLWYVLDAAHARPLVWQRPWGMPGASPVGW